MQCVSNCQLSMFSQTYQLQDNYKPMIMSVIISATRQLQNNDYVCNNINYKTTIMSVIISTTRKLQNNDYVCNNINYKTATKQRLCL